MEIKVGDKVRIAGKWQEWWNKEFQDRVIIPQAEFVVSKIDEGFTDGRGPRFRMDCIVPMSLRDYLHDETWTFWDDEVELVRATCPMEVHDGH